MSPSIDRLALFTLAAGTGLVASTSAQLPATRAAGLAEARPTHDIAWIDFDGDRLLDAHVVSEGGRSYLLRNTGLGSFEDVSASAGLETSVSSFSAWEDFDHDGAIDLYLGSSTGAGRLYQNTGSGTFVDITQQAGLAASRAAQGASWFDYDGDHWMDLLLEGVSGPELFRNLAGQGFEAVSFGPTFAVEARAEASHVRVGRPEAESSTDESDDSSGDLPLGSRTKGSRTVLPATEAASSAPDRTSSPAGPVSFMVPMSLDESFVNDDENEVDSADVVDFSLTGADVSTLSGTVRHENAGTFPALSVEGSGFFAADGGGLDSSVGAGVRVFRDSSGAGNIFAYDYGVGSPLDLQLQGPGGRLGIGTDSPASTLDVAGAVSVDGSEVIDDAGVWVGSLPSIELSGQPSLIQALANGGTNEVLLNTVSHNTSTDYFDPTSTANGVRILEAGTYRISLGMVLEGSGLLRAEYFVGTGAVSGGVTSMRTLINEFGLPGDERSYFGSKTVTLPANTTLRVHVFLSGAASVYNNIQPTIFRIEKI